MRPSSEQSGAAEHACAQSAVFLRADGAGGDNDNTIGSLPQANDGQLALEMGLAFEAADDNSRLLLNAKQAAGAQPPATEAVICAALESRGVTRGIDMEAVRSAAAKLEAGEAVRGVCVVNGRPPVAGVDAVIEYRCRPGHGAAPITYASRAGLPECPSERVCMKGEVVARRTPPIPGTAGYDVLGEELVADEVTDLVLVPGDDVQVNGDELIAQTDGTLVFDGDKVGVRRLLTVVRNLNGTKDDIDFDGDVHLNGSVCGGVTVRASGDIIASNSVKDAKIVSSGGSVHLRQGAFGLRRGVVYAAHDIHARFAEQVTLFARGDIRIEVGAMMSRLIAHREIDVSTGPGRIVGGVHIAGHRVRANQIGNESDVPVRLYCGLTPAQVTHRAKFEIKRYQIEAEMTSAQEAAELIRRLVADVAMLPDDKQAAYTRLLQAVSACRDKLRRLEEAGRPGEEEGGGAPDAQIEVLRELHAGTFIEINGREIEINEMQRACRVVCKQGKAVVAGP